MHRTFSDPETSSNPRALVRFINGYQQSTTNFLQDGQASRRPPPCGHAKKATTFGEVAGPGDVVPRGCQGGCADFCEAGNLAGVSSLTAAAASKFGKSFPASPVVPALDLLRCGISTQETSSIGSCIAAAMGKMRACRDLNSNSDDSARARAAATLSAEGCFNVAGREISAKEFSCGTWSCLSGNGCEPCWFHRKANGCRHGWECCRCHLHTIAGPNKARRKRYRQRMERLSASTEAGLRLTNF